VRRPHGTQSNKQPLPAAQINPNGNTKADSPRSEMSAAAQPFKDKPRQSPLGGVESL
jgi:hypothetical protein